MTKKPKPSSRFRRRNYGRNHAYYLRLANGEEVKLDGVTTLLGNGLPKPALVNWAANTTAEYAVDNWDKLTELPASDKLKELKAAKNRKRDEAAARGTEVHNYAERIALGEEIEVPDALRGHVESAVKFLDDFEVEVIATERSVFHESARYAGTFDLLLKSKKFPGKVILADWKTNRSGIFPETALQLTAYANATHYLDADGNEQPVADLGINELWAVWVRSDGYEVYRMEFSEQTWHAFQWIAATARGAANREVADAWKSAPLRVGDAA